MQAYKKTTGLEVANAGRVNDDLLAFAELGQTVAGKLEERKNYLIKQSKLKFYNAARELVATGQFDPSSGDSPEEKEEFNLRIEQAMKHVKRANLLSLDTRS